MITVTLVIITTVGIQTTMQVATGATQPIQIWNGKFATKCPKLFLGELANRGESSFHTSIDSVAADITTSAATQATTREVTGATQLTQKSDGNSVLKQTILSRIINFQ